MNALLNLSFIIVVPFITGINSYITFILLFVVVIKGWLSVGGFIAFSPIIFLFMIVLFLVEFIVDKNPWVDVIWEIFHIPIRPAISVLIFYLAYPHKIFAFKFIVYFIAMIITLTSLFTKLSIRSSINLSPHCFKNWIFSILEILFVMINVSLLCISPVISLLITAISIVLSIFIIKYRGKNIFIMINNLRRLFAAETIIKIQHRDTDT
ncbi:MAG: DUF4126 domain-containing protein [Candidatus Hydrogenedentota bacterium]